MKTTTIPPLRVDPALRREAESVLHEGETLSSLMLEALTTQVAQRRDQQKFLARGLASRDRARRTGRYVSSEAVTKRLARRLDGAKRRRT